MYHLMNPFIYAKYNSEFRKAFYEISQFRCFGINQRLRKKYTAQILRSESGKNRRTSIESNF